MLAARLGHFLDQERPRLVLADVLLHLVQRDESQGNFAVDRERVANSADHLLGGNVVDLGELLLEQSPRLPRACGEVRVHVQQRLRDVRGDVEVAELLVPLFSSGLDASPDVVEVSLVAQPHHEAGERVLLGQPSRLENDVQQFEAHVVAGARAELSRCRMNPAQAARRRSQLLQLVGDVGRDADDTAGGGSVVKGEVDPQRPEHLYEVRLAAAIKAAYPDPGLCRLVHVAQKGVEDPTHALGVFAIAHERLQLVAQGKHLGGGATVRDLGDAIVEQPVLRRVLDVDLSVVHSASAPSCAVIGTAM